MDKSSKQNFIVFLKNVLKILIHFSKNQVALGWACFDTGMALLIEMNSAIAKPDSKPL